MKAFFMSLFSSNGKVSSTRFITIITAMTILGVYVFHNVVAIKNGGDYVDFPANSVMVLLIVSGAKVAQHVSEQRTCSKEPETKPGE